MDDQANPDLTLIQKLDQRQNEVLTQLDELNDRIEAVLAAWQREDQPEPKPLVDAA